VKASTTISVATKVGKTVLEPLTRIAPKAGEQRFKVALGKRASGTATVEVTTLGAAGGPTKTATTKVTLK
jgi:hypothetical protein